LTLVVTLNYSGVKIRHYHRSPTVTLAQQLKKSDMTWNISFNNLWRARG